VIDLAPFVVAGIVTGCIYAIAAMGLVLTYRTTGLFNFAHGAMGMVVAFGFYQLRTEWGVPTAISILIALAIVAPLLGTVIDRLLFRSLEGSSQASKVVVTIGLLILLQQGAEIIYGTGSRRVEPFLPNGHINAGSVRIGYDQLIIVAAAFVVLGALTVFLRTTRMGVAMRAVVDNRDLVDLAGFKPERITTFTWALGCFLAGLAGILFAPLVELSPIALTLLVIKAYAAAILGRLVSLPLTLLGGIAVGVAEAVSLKLFDSNPEFVNRLRPSLAFILLFGVLLLAKRGTLRELGVSAPWQGVVRAKELTLGRIGVLVAGLAVLALTLSEARVFVLGNAIVLSCIFLSLTVLTGTTGLLNLGQAALAGTGAFMYIHLTTDWGVPFWLALVLAGLSVVPLGLAIAVPALRLPGLFLALATFGFGQLIDGLLFGWYPFSGGQDGLRGTRPSLLQTDLRYVLFLVVMLALFMLVVRGIRGTALGRTLTAMRDSPTATATLGVNLLWPKMAVFAASAFMAGVAGALYAGHLQVASKNFFFTFNSVVWVAVVVVGGVQSALGAVLGAFLLTWAPEVLASHDALLDYITPAFGLGAILLARRPGGLVSLLSLLRPSRLITSRPRRPVAPVAVVSADG
jgi:branched-subunit amino acid ABC-type transport system permease component